MMDVFYSKSLSAIPSVRHGFFTRLGGVSVGPFCSLNCSETGGDNPASVAQNRGFVAAQMGVESVNLITCRQVHSPLAHIVTGENVRQSKAEADALVTKEKALALGILTADCAPILFADAQAGVIAAAHAGWRGALGGVVEATLRAMEECGATREAVCAAIGPCIWQASYEVGPDFPAPFEEESPENPRFFRKAEKEGHFLFDLPGYVAAKLTKAGVTCVDPSLADTYADETHFFSYRRATKRGQKVEGRLISCIALKGKP